MSPRQPHSTWTVKAHNLRATQAAILVDVLMEIDPHDPAVERRYVGSNDSDHARLRGLRAIGPGVSGAMHGTDPLRALLAKEDRRP